MSDLLQKEKNSPMEETSQNEHQRTLWDWIQLLLIPLIILISIFWLSLQQSRTSLQVGREQRETTIQIAEDQQREQILITYMEGITDLMLHDKLLEADAKSPVRLAAQAKTNETLRVLDPTRKAAILRFLYTTRIINNDVHAIDLTDADLRSTVMPQGDLRDSYLNGANLTGANLPGINLSYASCKYTNLSKSNLARADLRGADLHGADLSGADLSGANLKDVTGTTPDQLAKAKLAGATMPDGSQHA